LPNFIIIGVMKAGTTSLHFYLDQHPEIYMCPLTEPRFFSFEGERLTFRGPGDKIVNKHAVTDLEKYKKLFVGVKNEIAVGEKSPSYIHMAKAAERIKHYIPNAKIIAMLRNPIDRAFSAFLMHTRNGNEKLSFEQALEMEELRLKNNWSWGWGYVYLGLYARQLKIYFGLFERKNLLIILFEDFVSNPQWVLKKIFNFLGVNDDFSPNLKNKYNISGIPKIKILHRSLFNIKNTFYFLKPYVPVFIKNRIKDIEKSMLNKPIMDINTRKKLTNIFEKDISELEELLDRDLSIWRVY